MNRIKNILISFVLLIFLYGCNDMASTPEKWALDDYTTFEIGSNFTDHMWALASGDSNYEAFVYNDIDLIDYQSLSNWYELLYTHRIDYLYPQIYYYIPISHNFDSKEAWSDYFRDWEQAIEEKDYDIIKPYVTGLSIEAYVASHFENASQDYWETIFIDQMPMLHEINETFIEGFKAYEDRIWPEVSGILKRKSNFINETLLITDLRADWMHFTKEVYETKRIVFTLSYVKHTDFDYVSLTDDKVHLYYNLKEDPYEFTEIISQRMGYVLIKQDAEALLSTITTAYEPLLEDYDLYEIVDETFEFYAAMYNKFILGFKTEKFKSLLSKNPDWAYLELFLPPTKGASELVSEGLIYLLDRLEEKKPYLFYDGLHYQGVVYETMDLENQILHYQVGHPMVLEKEGELEILYEDPASEPVLQNNHIMFIAPFLNQVIKNLYIYDLESETLEQLTFYSSIDQNAVFDFLWLEDKVYFVKSFAYGNGENPLIGILDLADKTISELELSQDEDYEILQLFEEDGNVMMKLKLSDESVVIKKVSQ